jgi:tetratricopeptide (TPR) repeat protein
MLPSMAVDAALRQGWFGKMVWTVPMSNPDQPLSLEILRKQLAENGMAKQSEIDSFQLDGNVAKGALREVPVNAATLPHLPEINGPVVVHVDLSYFAPLYKNEISTPLLPIVAGTFKALQARKLQVLAVTVSRGNLDRSLPLDVRFLGDIVKELMKTPALLDQPLSDHWQRKANTLYLEHLFQKEKVRETLLEMESEAPKDASVKFALYRLAAQSQNEGTKALGYLEKAVRLDKIYGLEYLALADLAYERKFPGEALRMLSLAARVFPDNPLIKLQLAQLADELGDRKTAQHLAGQLRKLSWSPVYYPQMPDYLKGFTDFLQQEPPPAAAAPPQASPSPPGKPAGPLPTGHPAAMPPGHP